MGHHSSSGNSSRDQVWSQGEVEDEGTRLDGEWTRERESDAASEEPQSRSKEHGFEGEIDVVVKEECDRRPLGRFEDRSQL